MIDKNGAHCDGCCNAEDLYGHAFQFIVKKIKSYGWKIVKCGTGWFHYCPACVEDGKHQPRKKQPEQYQPTLSDIIGI